MRSMRIVPMLLVVFAAGLAAQSTLTGQWRTDVVAGGLKTFGEVVLDLKAEGDTLTGTATMGDRRGWPGSAPIQDGKIEGNRFSFTWTGRIASCGGARSVCDYPHLTFEGTVDGDQVTVSIGGDYEMTLRGERVPPR